MDEVDFTVLFAAAAFELGADGAGDAAAGTADMNEATVAARRNMNRKVIPARLARDNMRILSIAAPTDPVGRSAQSQLGTSTGISITVSQKILSCDKGCLALSQNGHIRPNGPAEKRAYSRTESVERRNRNIIHENKRRITDHV
ncbi:MAG TPA: hypothetical protein VG756_31955 [Pseudonocardiaceae bacterium]|nr:hypothetical protein [Pseudonocardiaceae bacterium]